MVLITVNTEEEYPPDPPPLQDTNAQFADPLPGRLANMTARYMNQYGSPHCALCCTLWQIFELWQPSVLHLVVHIGTGCLLIYVASTLISALVKVLYLILCLSGMSLASDLSQDLWQSIRILRIWVWIPLLVCLHMRTAQMEVWKRLSGSGSGYLCVRSGFTHPFSTIHGQKGFHNCQKFSFTKKETVCCER